MCAPKTCATPVRWGGLCAIGLSAFAVTTTIAVASPPAPWRVAATVIAFIAAGIGMMRCLAMQRVALDLSGWCDCAKPTVTVRIIDAAEATRPEWEHDDTTKERSYAGAASAR